MPTFGYWNIRGLASPIRYLLEYCGVEYEERLYKVTLNEDGTYNKDDWLNEKFNLGLDLPNLPYYIDGSLKLTQSLTILRYIAEKHNLGGDTLEDKASINMIANEIMDSKVIITKFWYGFGGDFEKDRENVEQLVITKLTALHKYLKDNDWLYQNQISYADFFLYELLCALKAFTPTILDTLPKFVGYIQRFEQLPAIKKYMASPNYISSPFNGPSAKWGGKK